jgi:hypothetical protein
VLFQKQHFRSLTERLERQGHCVASLDFDFGDKPLDKFIDVPPYQYNWTDEQRENWRTDTYHLKVSIDGFACTCFGIIIRKSGAGTNQDTSGGHLRGTLATPSSE